MLRPKPLRSGPPVRASSATSPKVGTSTIARPLSVSITLSPLQFAPIAIARTWPDPLCTTRRCLEAAWISPERERASTAPSRFLVAIRPLSVRRAIGSAFARFSESQQQEFLRLFNELFVRSYLQKLLLFRQPKFRVGAEETRGETVVVATEVLVSEDAYEVDYEMHRQQDQWRAADVVVEGVSMTSNYSDQFATLLRDRSIDELLELMRRKLDRVVEKGEG